MSRQFNRRDFLPIGPFAATAPIFDVKLPHGLDFTLLNSPTPQKYLIETMPGGVALFDYNNDGLLDIFLVNGGRVTSPMLWPEKFDRSNPRYWNRLCRQNKDGSFTDVTEAAGLSSAGVGNYGMGVAIGDYDNDVRPDTLVTELPREIYGLYHNDGGGLFTNESLDSGWGVGLEDLDNDGWKDLLVTQGHVLDNVEAIDHSLRYLETPLLALNS
jgi:enediyne biosynthesis protein E4